ncbi:MAG: hypothetical protein ABI947_11480 [Chloroflexota bacterium]
MDAYLPRRITRIFQPRAAFQFLTIARYLGAIPTDDIHRRPPRVPASAGPLPTQPAPPCSVADAETADTLLPSLLPPNPAPSVNPSPDAA